MIHTLQDITSFKWATVTDDSPLRIKLDGDSTQLPFAPDSLIDPLGLAAGDRVRCELSGRGVVIVGRSGGAESAPLAHTHTNSQLSQQVISGKGASDAPSTYPPGISSMGINAAIASGWPTAYVTVLTVRVGSSRTFQEVVDKTTGETWVRAMGASGDTWGAFVRIPMASDAGIVKAIATGSYSSGSTLATGSGVSISRTFPSGRFTSVPRVVANPTISGRIQIACLSVTTTGFTARLDNFSGGTASDRDFNWIAIQET